MALSMKELPISTFSKFLTSSPSDYQFRMANSIP